MDILYMIICYVWMRFLMRYSYLVVFLIWIVLCFMFFDIWSVVIMYKILIDEIVLLLYGICYKFEEKLLYVNI